MLFEERYLKLLKQVVDKEVDSEGRYWDINMRLWLDPVAAFPVLQAREMDWQDIVESTDLKDFKSIVPKMWWHHIKQDQLNYQFINKANELTTILTVKSIEMMWELPELMVRCAFIHVLVAKTLKIVPRLIHINIGVGYITDVSLYNRYFTQAANSTLQAYPRFEIAEKATVKSYKNNMFEVFNYMHEPELFPTPVQEIEDDESE